VQGRFIPSAFPALRANTIGELAAQLNVDGAAVGATIAAYNAAIVPGGTFDATELDDCATRGLEPPKAHWALPIDTPPYFGYPLRAGHPENPANKILWIIGVPVRGALYVAVRPVDATSPILTWTLDPAGQTYPSTDDVPTAGCWHFDLGVGERHRWFVAPLRPVTDHQRRLVVQGEDAARIEDGAHACLEVVAVDGRQG